MLVALFTETDISMTSVPRLQRLILDFWSLKLPDKAHMNTILQFI